MLGFTTQPGGGANGATWATQPAVTVEDAGGNPITAATNPVSLTIGTQPGTGAATGCTTNPVNATAGVATFSGCQIVGTTGTYTLTASAPGLVNGTSGAFTITVGPAAQARLHHPARRRGQHGDLDHAARGDGRGLGREQGHRQLRPASPSAWPRTPAAHWPAPTRQ